MRTLVGAVTGAYDGRPPSDDATALRLDWRGPHDGSRNVNTGSLIGYWTG